MKIFDSNDNAKNIKIPKRDFSTNSTHSHKISLFILRKVRETIKYQKIQPDRRILHFSTICQINGSTPEPLASR